MQIADIVNVQVKNNVQNSPRLTQMAGIFDLQIEPETIRSWQINLSSIDINWNIGLIVGPSGSGKTTIAKHLYKNEMTSQFNWSHNKSFIDDFPQHMKIQDIIEILSSVGFTSPPNWLVPFHCLSNGEQFRVDMARRLAEANVETDIIVVDEFTSLVDRTVAQVASAAVAKRIRASNRKFIAVTCHYDIIDWLQPDWIIEMPKGEVTRRTVRPRPEIIGRVIRVKTQAWDIFKKYHYLGHSILKSAICFMLLIDDKPAAFCSAIAQPGRVNFWREHRTVCIPDYQGIGIGNKFADYVASLIACTDKTYRSTTSNPAMIISRQKSPNWICVKKPSRNKRSKPDKRKKHNPLRTRLGDPSRITTAWKYVGCKNYIDAAKFGII